MAKPYIHAQSSAKKFGGKPEDYEKIHEWFDQTKALLPDQRHRAILHSSFGIFLCTQVFGNTIKNSENKVISVRDVGEQHVLEDFGGKFIPTAQDYLQEIEYKDWMQNGNGYPPSFQKVNDTKKEEKKEPYFIVKSAYDNPPNAELNITDGSWRYPLTASYALTFSKPSGENVVLDGNAGIEGGCLPISNNSGKNVVYDGSREVIERKIHKKSKNRGADRLVD